MFIKNVLIFFFLKFLFGEISCDVGIFFVFFWQKLHTLNLKYIRISSMFNYALVKQFQS